MVTWGSDQKAWWVCENGHEWQARINHRANGVGCPICSSRKVFEGFNDLATTHPKIAAEWHPTKNEALTPSMIVAGSNKAVWWQCEKGHEWKAIVSSRTRPAGNGCPVCRESKGEKNIAAILSEKGISYKREITLTGCKDKRLLPFDFGIFKDEKLVCLIEYDGEQHFKSILRENSLEYLQKHDNIKNQYCKKHKIPLYRIPYTQFSNIDERVNGILEKVRLAP